MRISGWPAADSFATKSNVRCPIHAYPKEYPGNLDVGSPVSIYLLPVRF